MEAARFFQDPEAELGEPVVGGEDYPHPDTEGLHLVGAASEEVEISPGSVAVADEPVMTTEVSPEESPKVDLAVLAELDGLERFIKTTKAIPLLDAAQEIALAKRIERGDLEAKQDLIEANLRLVVYVARRYEDRGLVLGDLIQSGVDGLIRASEKFDHRKGFKFSTYAVPWIKKTIQEGIVEGGRTFGMPIRIDEKIRRMNRLEQSLAQTKGREPTEAELAAEMDEPPENIRLFKKADIVPTSLDKPTGDIPLTLSGLVGADEVDVAETAIGNAMNIDRKATLMEAIETHLRPREATVVLRFFGVNRPHAESIEDIAVSLGTTPHAVMAAKTKGLRRLREHAASEIRAVA